MYAKYVKPLTRMAFMVLFEKIVRRIGEERFRYAVGDLFFIVCLDLGIGRSLTVALMPLLQ